MRADDDESHCRAASELISVRLMSSGGVGVEDGVCFATS